MRYILDASVAAKIVLPETDSDKARKLIAEFDQGLHELISPDIFSVEIAHALTRAERQKRINIGEALTLWSQALSIPPRFVRHRPFLPRAVAISSMARAGVYDCLYIALAERESCELVTADEKLVNNLQIQKLFPFVIPLSSL